MILSRAGQYLYKYERKRYTFRERFAWLFDLFTRRQRILVPADPEHFADVSFYQAGMDWDVYALHARAAIIRIGQNTWPDTSFVTFYEQAKARGIALGGYWFFDGRASPDQQLAVIKSQMSGRSLELELFVDWEKNYGGAYEGLPRVVELMQKIEAAGIKCKAVGMYTGYYWFSDNSNATANAGQYTYLKQRPLWLAWYSAASVVKVPQPWVDWTHWQYGTPSLKWGQPTVEIDANYFNGSKAQFGQKYLAGQSVPDGGEMEEYKIVTAALKIRTAPPVGSVLGPDAGKVMSLNDLIHVSAKDAASGWLKIEKWIKAAGGEVYPPDGVQWWCSGLTSYVQFVRLVDVPEPPPAEGVADMPYNITLGGGTSPYVETIVSGVVKAK